MQRAHVAALFFDLRGTAEFQTRSPSRLMRAHPSGDVVLNQRLQMKLHFCVQFPLQTLPAKQRAQQPHGLLLFHGAQNEPDGFRKPLPIRGFHRQLLPSEFCERVVLGAAAALRRTPFALQPSAIF